MPPHAPFDPLKYVKELESVGFTREQAEVQAETFFSIVQEQLATKYDLKELENELKQNMKELENELKQDMQRLENELKQNIKELDAKTTTQIELLRRDLKLWFGSMLMTLILAFSTLVTLIPHLTGR